MRDYIFLQSSASMTRVRVVPLIAIALAGAILSLLTLAGIALGELAAFLPWSLGGAALALAISRLVRSGRGTRVGRAIWVLCGAVIGAWGLLALFVLSEGGNAGSVSVEALTALAQASAIGVVYGLVFATVVLAMSDRG